ncbi:hypothetical protein H2203_009105 [Taxawa tesnikishii (nom. ined.)]|nr:hypothetical protein H2203_009105 [Dothideales sp. JES 119]
MADYAKMKNAELEALLVERGLPKTGKKADMVKRLEEDDKAKSSAPSKATNEDEIDWDDEPAATDAKTTTTASAVAEAKTATTEPAAAALAAGGQGQVDNPQAVPNQVVGEDVTNTGSLAVSKPDEEAPAATGATTAVESTEAVAPAEEKKEPVDFSSGLAKTTLDEEIEKRKARAKKFGLDVEKDETLKALERAKKFGATELPGNLNEALPEKRERKRGREGGEENGDSKRRGARGRPDLGGRRGSSRRNTPRSGTPNKGAGAGTGTAPQAKAAGGGPTWMSEADRAKAEARKAKFAS